MLSEKKGVVHKRDEEETKKQEAQQRIWEAQENKRRQAEEAQNQAYERKWQAELKQIENLVNAKRAPVIKAQKACEESRYEFSNECKTYDASKASYEKYKSSICDYDEYEIRRKDKNADEKISKRRIECNSAQRSFE